MTVFSETLTVNLRFQGFWGIRKWKLKVDFIETKGIRLRRRAGEFHWNQGYSTEKEVGWYSLKPRVFDWEEGLRPPSQSKPLVSMKPPNLLLSRNPWFQWNHLPSFSVETLGFNETTFSFNFWTPKNRETADILLKFHWNRQKKKKNVRFPFKYHHRFQVLTPKNT